MSIVLISLDDQEYRLPWNFRMESLELGVIDQNTTRRRRFGRKPFRVSDRMRAPHEIVITGRIYSTKENYLDALAELRDKEAWLREAIQSPAQVVHETAAGFNTFEVSGSAPPKFEFDSHARVLNVTLKLWPASAFGLFEFRVAGNLPCEPMVNERTSGTSYFAEFFMAPGPQVIGQTGDSSMNTLYGRTWGCLFCNDASLFFVQWDPDAQVWNVIGEGIPPLPEFTGSERRFSLTFDQAARLIMAYESGGTIFVTRWDPSEGEYKSNVDFPGVDPVLLVDATVMFHVPGSDIVLFYLSADREQVRYRIQGETYATPHTLYDHEAPLVLDRAERLPWRYQLLVSDADGEPITDASVVQVLRSELYPLRVRIAAAQAQITGVGDGDYVQVIVPVVTPNEEIEAIITGIGDGDYGEPLVEADAGREEIEAAITGVGDGDYVEPIVEAEPDREQIEAAITGVGDGDYQEVIIALEVDIGEVEVTITGIGGGTYEEP